jgi:hypothetical protein
MVQVSYLLDCTVSWFNNCGKSGHFRLSASVCRALGKILVRPRDEKQVIQEEQDLDGCSCRIEVLGNDRVALICKGVEHEIITWTYSIRSRGFGKCLSIQYAS